METTPEYKRLEGVPRKDIINVTRAMVLLSSVRRAQERIFVASARRHQRQHQQGGGNIDNDSISLLFSSDRDDASFSASAMPSNIRGKWQHAASACLAENGKGGIPRVIGAGSGRDGATGAASSDNRVKIFKSDPWQQAFSRLPFVALRKLIGGIQINDGGSGSSASSRVLSLLDAEDTLAAGAAGFDEMLSGSSEWGVDGGNHENGCGRNEGGATAAFDWSGYICGDGNGRNVTGEERDNNER